LFEQIVPVDDEHMMKHPTPTTLCRGGSLSWFRGR